MRTNFQAGKPQQTYSPPTLRRQTVWPPFNCSNQPPSPMKYKYFHVLVLPSFPLLQTSNVTNIGIIHIFSEICITPNLCKILKLFLPNPCLYLQSCRIHLNLICVSFQEQRQNVSRFDFPPAQFGIQIRGNGKW